MTIAPFIVLLRGRDSQIAIFAYPPPKAPVAVGMRRLAAADSAAKLHTPQQKRLAAQTRPENGIMRGIGLLDAEARKRV